MLPRDIALFVRSAKTDARIQDLLPSLGAAAALEAVYAADPDPWASASSQYRYQTRKYEVLASLLPKRSFAHALDLGCGPGLLSRHLAAHADTVVGVDVSPSAIATARARSTDLANVTYEVHDLLALPDAFDGRFDLVVVADVLYYLVALAPERLDAIAGRIARLLAPGGLCLLANHYVLWLDADSRRSRRIHDAFRKSNAFVAVQEFRRPFYLVTILALRGSGSS